MAASKAERLKPEPATRFGRGRPSRAQVQEIDRRVLDAARECFLCVGFDRTSMESVAHAAGVTKATLYLRYRDRLSLLKAVIADRLAEWSTVASQTDWMLGDTLAERLRHYAEAVLIWTRTPEVRAFRKLIASCWGEAGQVAQDLQAFLQAPMIALLERDIAEFGRTPEREVGDPRQIAAIFLAMLAAFDTFSQAGEPDTENIRAFADKSVAILLLGQAGW
jgi:TetR/AcrR family transcriptional repressor of mexJK operon